MARRIYARVQPELLRWARESAGYGVAQATRKLRLRRQEQLAAFESGEEIPTVSQLRKVANLYKRPLSVFFLPAPPAEPPPLHDFRTMAEAEKIALTPELLLEQRRARRRRVLALELRAQLDRPAEPIALQADIRDGIADTSEAIRNWLGIGLDEQSTWIGPYDGLNRWTVALEAKDILVFQTGEIDLSVMRGFSLSETLLPAIVLNAKDAPRARVFTLMHELAHLVLRQGGICDPPYLVGQQLTGDQRVEAFCNRVAGSVLVPDVPFLEDDTVRLATARRPWTNEELKALAQRFAVSREVILLRLLSLGRASDNFVQQKLREFKEQYAAIGRRPLDRRGFPPVYRLVVRDNGRPFTRLVLEALHRDAITHAEASDYLHVRLKHLPKIAADVGATGMES